MIDYPLASSTWGKEEYKAIQSVIDKDNYTMGKKVMQFEADFARYLNVNHCVMVSSGSTANLISTAALFHTKIPKLQRGDEVIVPAVSWSTTYFPLQQYGLKLKFVDIDIQTLNYNLEALNDAISTETKMIVVVNLLGNPNDFNHISSLISGKDILLFEDNCESLGAEFESKKTGTFGIMGTFSSFFSHHIATMEGGMIAVNDEELYHVLLSLRAHGWTRNLPKKNHVANKSDDSFSESFRFVLPGYNVRPLEMSGAIGIEQLKKLDTFIIERRKNAKLFESLFADDKDFFIQKEVCKSSWFGFSLIIKPNSNKSRAEVIQTLNNNNIECRPIVTGNFTKNEVMKYFNYEIFNNLDNANLLDSNGFFVGNHHTPLNDQISLLREVLS
jgi:CDP-6-deoxy-D-xylo-4-hexulose-3-dehydrase